MTRHRLRPILAVLMILVLLLTLLPSHLAFANTSPLSETQAVELLRAYSIVRGDPDRGLGLEDKLTRAQTAALFVRATGAEELAKVLADVVPFHDAKGHWAAGEMAMANRLGLMRGDGDGTFRPNAEITYAEILTVLLRIIHKEPTGPWQRSVIMAEAQKLGLTPYAPEATSPALRGKVFWSMALAFTQVPLPSGETAMQKYLDHTAPQLTLDQQPTTTDNASLTVTGTATGASRVVAMRQPAALDSSTGRFTTAVPLAVGQNVIQVDAFDLAGNKASAFLTVERRTSAGRIEITGPATIQAGSSVQLQVSVYDSQGRQMTNPQGLQARLSSNLATFDPTTNTLRAGTRGGRDTLTLTLGEVSRSYSFDITATSSRVTHLSFASVNDGRTPSVDKPFTVRVHALDADGRLVTDDNGRSVTLSSNAMTGVTINPTTAQTQSGVATFTVTGTVRQQGLLSATSPGITGAETVVNLVSGTRVVLRAGHSTLRPDGTSNTGIYAILQNESGQTIANNFDSDITLTLNQTGTDAALSGALLTIARGQTNSQQVVLRAGIVSGQAVISGTVTSHASLSVEAARISIQDPLSPVKLQLTVNPGQNLPGTAIAVTVRVLDSQDRLVQTGSYAFQITPSTSNNDPVTNGMPEGVQLTFASSAYRPVDDGRVPADPLNDATAIIGRTYQGTATLHLTYNRSGTVKLTPRLLPATDSGYHPTLGFGQANGSTQLTGLPLDVTYAGTPAAVQLKVDSLLGNAQPGGSTIAGRSMTIRAAVVDANGAAIPGYSQEITLTRGASGNLITAVSGSNRKAAVNGAAEFTITTSGTNGFDTYTASVGNFTSQPVTVQVRNQAPTAPTVVAIRGIKAGDLSPSTGYVAPDADYMDIQLQPDTTSRAPQNWAAAKVYRKGESSPLFTSGAIDLKSALPVVRVPTSALRAGRYTYEVVVNNGAGDSPRTADLGLSEATSAVHNPNYRVVSGLYDAATGKLLITNSGLPSDGTLDLNKLSLSKNDNRVNLGAATLENRSASTLTLTLGGLSAQVVPDTFNGVVYLRAEDAWYKSADGSQIAPAQLQTALIKPMAVISHATLDLPARRLLLHGAGFTHGTLALDKIKVARGEQVVALRTGSTGADQVVATTDTQVTIGLAPSSLEAIAALPGPDLAVTTETGWLNVTSNGQTYKAGAITGQFHQVFMKAAISSLQYNRQTKTLVLRGSGFTGATLKPERLMFRTPGSSTAWRPAANSQVSIVDDTTVELKLDSTDAGTFETRFSGASVFLNAEAGWLLDAQQRWAAPPPADSVLFMVPAR